MITLENMFVCLVFSVGGVEGSSNLRRVLFIYNMYNSIVKVSEKIVGPSATIIDRRKKV